MAVAGATTNQLEHAPVGGAAGEEGQEGLRLPLHSRAAAQRPAVSERRLAHGGNLVHVNRAYSNGPLEWDDIDRSWPIRCRRSWVNFMTKGDPNGSGLPAWPQYKDMSKDKVMVFGDTVQVEASVPAEKMAFFNARLRAADEGQLTDWCPRRVLLTALASVMLAAPAFAQTKPNVVLIVMDDVGYGDYRGVRRSRYQDAERRSSGQGRREVHRLLRRAIVHSDTGGADHGTLLPAHRPGKPAGRSTRGRARPRRERPFAATTDEERRLCHRSHRQVAPRLSAGPAAEGARLRLFLRLPERTGGLLPAHGPERKTGPVRKRQAGHRGRLHDRSDHRSRRSGLSIRSKRQPFFLEVA